jgi:hypothetical protein
MASPTSLKHAGSDTASPTKSNTSTATSPPKSKPDSSTHSNTAGPPPCTPSRPRRTPPLAERITSAGSHYPPRHTHHRPDRLTRPHNTAAASPGKRRPYSFPTNPRTRVFRSPSAASNRPDDTPSHPTGHQPAHAAASRTQPPPPDSNRARPDHGQARLTPVDVGCRRRECTATPHGRWSNPDHDRLLIFSFTPLSIFIQATMDSPARSTPGQQKGPLTWTFIQNQRAYRDRRADRI